MNTENKVLTNSRSYFIDAKAFDERPDAFDKNTSSIFKAVESFVLQEGYPCVGAQGSINGKTYALGIFDSMDQGNDIQGLSLGLNQYLDIMSERPSNLLTYLAVFPKTTVRDEMHYENSMWSLLQELNKTDDSDWDDTVDSDPQSAKFSFSYGGKAFFLVGLNPKSSRKARRFKYPTIAFNLQVQFDELREKGRFDTMREATRARELAFDGSVNPMLADFGKGSQAAQYSGRKVGKNWKCPFLAKNARAYDHKD